MVTVLIVQSLIYSARLIITTKSAIYDNLIGELRHRRTWDIIWL